MEKAKNISLGLDIGTTTISASVVDIAEKKQVRAYTVANQSFIKTDATFKKEQDAELIFAKVERLLKEILLEYPTVSKIGVTGQMHGIVYLDEKGKAVSNLFTWQDLRAGQPFRNGRSYADEITFLTGKGMSVGYGVATHYFNVKNGLVPKNATKFCTIADYITARLCKKNEPKIHATNAGGVGLFELGTNDFNFIAIEKLGLAKELFPVVVENNYIVDILSSELSVEEMSSSIRNLAFKQGSKDNISIIVVKLNPN